LLARYREFAWERLNEVMDDMELACADCNEKKVRSLMKDLVPEWGGYLAKVSRERVTIANHDEAASEVQVPTLH